MSGECNICGHNGCVENNHAIVNRKTIQFGIGTLERMLQDLCLTNIVLDEKDLQEIINKLWPVLICEHELN